MKADVTVVILTYNEEANLAQALDSVVDWAAHILILDSFSTDRTLEIAAKYPCEVHQHKFKNYSDQRNHALSLNIPTEWILFLDADEWIPENLKNEISQILQLKPSENGFFLNRRFIWMGKWIRRGYYPSYILRLFRKGKGKCEDRPINEHILVEGATKKLRNDFMHEDRRGIEPWIDRHNEYSTLEAIELLKSSADRGKYVDARFFGSQTQRKRWLRYRLWNRLPPLIRPFIYFFYRYFLTGAFLEGRAAFCYHFLQGLWAKFLTDVKYVELKRKAKLPTAPTESEEAGQVRRLQRRR